MKNLTKILTLCLLVCVMVVVSACNVNKHNFSTDWHNDADNHWHACIDEGCEEKSDVVAHTYGEGVVTTPATEEAEGVMTYTCTVCGYAKTEAIAKLEPTVHTHSLTIVDEVAPTCTDTGVKAYYTCSDCDEIFADAEGNTTIEAPEIIPAKDHIEEPFGTTIEATCTTAGQTAGIMCSVCKEVLVPQKLTGTAAHSFVEYTSNNDATCTKNGTEYAKCENCTFVDIRNIADSMLAHVYTEKISDKDHLKTAAVSCLEKNTYWYDCATCDAVSDELFYESDIIGTHNVSADWTSEEGKHFHKCTNEGCTYVEDEAECSDVTTDTDHKCDVCGADGVSDHVYSAWEKVDENNHKHICTCGNEEVKAHEWNEGEETKAPNHTKEGEMTFTCTLCPATKTESIPVLTEHTYDRKDTTVENAWVSDATCESPAIYKKSCICGAVSETETFTYGEELGHNWDDGVVTTDPTCIAEGEKTFTCERNCKKYESVPMVDHTVEILPSVAPTCTATGLTQGEKCSVCHEVFVAQEEIAATHTWDDGVVTIANSVGTITYTCKKCSATEQKSGPVPAEAHVCDHLVSGVETEYDKWTACSVCGAKSWANSAYNKYTGSGVKHGSADVYLPKEGGDPTVAADMVKQSVTVSDVAVSYNLVAGNDKSKSYVEFTYTFTADAAMTVNVYVNGRSTNTSNNVNAKVQINKFMKLFQGDTEIAIGDSAAFPAYVEGRNYWTEQQVATLDLVAGTNTFTFRFTKDVTFNTSKAYGGYISYFRFAEGSKALSGCENNIHTLEKVAEVNPTCFANGMKAHYACADCGELFDLESMIVTDAKYLVIPQLDHIYENVTRLQEDGSYAYVCTRGCDAVKAHTCTGEGNYLIIAREPNQVWYEDGDTFNPDRMEVYLSTACAEGCSGNTVVAGHLYGYGALTYTYQNGDSFKAGDTYVTINYNKDGVSCSAQLPVTVTAVGNTLTVDNSSDGFTFKDMTNDNRATGSRTNDQGAVGQSAYGGTYTNNFANGDIAKFTFTLDEAKDGANIVLRACTDRMNGAGGHPPYANAISVNDVVTIKVDGVVVEFSDDVMFEGTVTNLDQNNNRWVWTNWSSLDLGTYDLDAGEHTVEFIINTVLGGSIAGADAQSYSASIQIDCLNVFFE